MPITGVTLILGFHVVIGYQLTHFQQLTEYGAASDVFTPSKEDERSMALAARARKGDYDDGIISRLPEVYSEY